MQLPVYSPKGTKTSKKVTVDDVVFNAPVNEHLLQMAVYVYRSNQRSVAAHTKTRSEVRGGGAKPWRQKGTGRARHGSIRSPIWKGGGVTFGPRSDRNYKKKLTKKMRKNAVRSIFSQFAGEKKVLILESTDLKDERLTKQVISLYEKLPVEGNVLFIQPERNRELYLGARNLPYAGVINVEDVNVYTLATYDYIVILQDALDKIHAFWGTDAGDRKREQKAVRVKKEAHKKVAEDSKSKQKEGSVGSLKISERIKTALEKAGIQSVDELREKVDSGKKIAGVGKKSEDELKKVLGL